MRNTSPSLGCAVLAFAAATSALPLAPASAQPAFEVITTQQELIAAGLGGPNAAPIQAQLLDDTLVFASGFGEGSRLLRASGPGFRTLSTELLSGSTVSPITGEPLDTLVDFTATRGGVATIAFSGPFQELGPDDGGLFLRPAPEDPLRTLSTLGDLPGFPRAVVGGEGGLLALAARDAGADNGVYLVNEATGTQTRLAADGAPVLNDPGVTVENFQLSDGSLDGRTLAAIATDSGFDRRLVTVSPLGVISLLEADEELTDAAGATFDVAFPQSAVRDDGRTVARVIVTDDTRAERDAIVSFDTGGNPTVLAVASRDGSAGASIADLTNSGGNLATDGLNTVFVVNEGETSDAFLFDGSSVTRLFGTGDAFLDGELTVVDFSGEALQDDLLVFTAFYNDANGTARRALATFVIPEPTSLLAASLLGLTLLTRGRRAAA